MAHETGDPQMVFPCYHGPARLNLDVGNMAEAEPYLPRRMEFATSTGSTEARGVLPFFD
ncbi:hypothetical protein GGI59_004491 [Rhizobium lentis]|uniref:Uncharacterized protein n=1 Tax=Rhizobium lentis TaxID=1138194 RepID=A0A7W8XH68_9HYPH|nr:hypothetical protein [Rhizobium lentis]MBB5552264.1 hypothetical protein [Rhizobium lentis]MBB5562802.1 hypothetical protein [Rhizobium lentis]MBB5570985.1 hypothetical protein [Rhizobium lentis]